MSQGYIGRKVGQNRFRIILFYVWVKFSFIGSFRKTLDTWFAKKINASTYIVYTIGMSDKTYRIKNSIANTINLVAWYMQLLHCTYAILT
jgi:hypothetical protein